MAKKWAEMTGELMEALTIELARKMDESRARDAAETERRLTGFQQARPQLERASKERVDRAKKRHREIRAAADVLVRGGTESRAVVGCLARKFGLSRSQIRKILKNKRARR